VVALTTTNNVTLATNCNNSDSDTIIRPNPLMLQSIELFLADFAKLKIIFP
jgi:hypothetical protein